MLPPPITRTRVVRARARTAAGICFVLVLGSFPFATGCMSREAPAHESGTAMTGAPVPQTEDKTAVAASASAASTQNAPIAFDSDPGGAHPSAKKVAPGSYGTLGSVGGFGHGAGDSFGYGAGGGTGMGYGGVGGGVGVAKPRTPGGYNALGGPVGATALAAPVSPVSAVPMLDANARYATTYRPGGAALAAFDAALSKGAIPKASVDLVGDFGAKYGKVLAAPDKEAMAFAVDLDRTAIGPNGGDVHLRISMKGSDVAPLRAPRAVHVVLDVSGSMSGAAIDNARKAAEALVEKLDPTDHFSLVTFSNDAAVVVPAGAIGPRKKDVLQKIRAIQTEGGTNVSAGLDLGYAQAHATGAPDGAVKIVMLLSDGQANGGDTDPKSLARRSAHAFQEGVQTSTFGIGTDFDASLLASVADQGAGAYYYLADSAQIVPAVAKELDARLVPVAQALEVRVRLRSGTLPTKVFGSHVLDEGSAALVRAQEVAVDQQVAKKDGIAKDRKEDAQGGMRFFVPAFARGDRHAMLLSFRLPAGMGDKVIASVEIKYKDRLAKKNVTKEIAVHMTYAGSDADAASGIAKDVQATVQAFSAGDTVWRAAELVERGDRSGAVLLLRERAKVLRKAKETLGQPGLEEDALRLDRLADAVLGPSQMQDPMVLAVLLRGSGAGYLR